MTAKYDVVVLGSGPGGYTAAFRAADLGQSVALVERYDRLGGVCLNVGCIPSKALLHVGQVIDSAAKLADHGVRFGQPDIDLGALRHFKDGVVAKLTQGLAGLAKRRKVTVITGQGQFADAHHLRVQGPDGEQLIAFNHCIIAAGSRVVRIPGLPENDPRIMDSTSALTLPEVPPRLLVIGGGIIGLEMACVYRALGAEVSVVEMMDQLMAGADAALVKPLHQHLSQLGVQIWTQSKVLDVAASDACLTVKFEGEQAPAQAEFDRILVAVGRRPNGDQLAAELAGVQVDERGFIPVDAQLRSSQPHIFAIGDVIGQPMLAHKASYEGKLAAEVIAGHDRIADARVIPSVAYTDPEVAWVGLTESVAKAQGTPIEVSTFPWAASGRALGMDRSEGLTRLISDPDSGRLLGAGVVGSHAGDLIAELTLAIEMGATIADLALTIHPHPTLSESVMMAAEIAEGTITDLYMPKR